MSTVIAGFLNRGHLNRSVNLEFGRKTYSGVLRRFTQETNGVHVFITSSDNGVIVASVDLKADHQLEIRDTK